MILTESETETLLKALTYKRMFGIPLPYINKPRFMTINLDVNLRLLNSNIVLAEYNDIVAARMLDYEYKFSDELEEIRIDLAETERLLEQEDNVRRAYISIPKTEFKANEYYQLGDVLYDPQYEDILYRVTNIMYQTLETEPKWDYTLGNITADGNVMWQAVPKSGYPTAWQSKEFVELYALRLPTEPEMDGIMFRAVQGKSVSNPTDEPEWNTTKGEFTYDRQLIWCCIEYVATANAWSPNTWYNLGDIVRSGANSYQVVGERRRSGNSGPDLTEKPDELIYENMLFTKEVIDDEIISLPWGTYFIIKPNISASIQQ